MQRTLTYIFQPLRYFLLNCLYVLILLQSQTANGQLYLEHDDNSIAFHKINLAAQNIQPNVVNAFLLNTFDLNRTHQFIEKQKLTDNKGFTHIRYVHHHNNHRVLGSDVIGHFKNGRLHSINGRLRRPTDYSGDVISATKALEKAKIASGATHFKWEDA